MQLLIFWFTKKRYCCQTRKYTLMPVCVCVYSLPPVGFFRLHDVCDIREKFGSTIFLLRVFLGASAKFLHLYFWIYHISPLKTKTPADSYWRENEWYNAGTRKDRHTTKADSDEKILKIRRLLKSNSSILNRIAPTNSTCWCTRVKTS